MSEQTTAELARALSDFRSDTRESLHGLRNEMTAQLGKISREVDDLGVSMQKGYVSQQLWEEVRRNQGERIGALENRMTKIEEASVNRYERMQTKVAVIEKDILKRLEDRDKEAKADRRLIITALAAPFVMLIVGMVLTATFMQ